MKRIAFLLVCLACGAAGFAAKSLLENEDIARALRDAAPTIAALALAVLLLLGCLLFLANALLKRWLRKRGVEPTMDNEEMVTALVDHFTTPDGVAHPTPENRRTTALVNLGLLLVRRGASELYFRITVAVVAGLAGAAGLYLTYELNKLTQEQNRRIVLQTDADIAQSVLLESTRRAALSDDLRIVLDASVTIRQDASQTCKPNSANVACWTPSSREQGAKLHFLSQPLFDQVSRFARQSTPYRIAVSSASPLDFELPLRDQFRFPLLSPERGRLLQALVAQDAYVGDIDFTYAQLTASDLREADLSDANLRYADFENADLRDAFLMRTTFVEANLQNANLSNSKGQGLNFTRANLNGASLNAAELAQPIFPDATMIAADLFGADIAGASFMRVDFTRSDLGRLRTKGSTFSLANLQEVKFNNSVIDASTFTSVNFFRAHLYQSILNDVDVSRSNFRDANLTEAKLNDVQVTAADFTGATFEGLRAPLVWAWRDQPPIGWPDDIPLTLCDYVDGVLNRAFRPDDCG
ncbi:pentapeptide repeat-containing protein [Tateyamaria omphalii]|uniref:Pentapeptide repeat-containing protein n=1 Tax=Tateyamaria omphalii TaxID=299262 RepID=A0A1P8MUA2_9RHOB|nr:pentapeptide repeat-containing protein [Tateyamaria omphalii]APX11583.1 hypothetical protein BWR18_07720 [Tateyamaria omphalii]